MLFETVAAASSEIAATPARGAKVKRLAELLTAVDPAEAVPVASWLSGELTQRQIGVGYAALRESVLPASEPSLSVLDVETLFEQIKACAGSGSQPARRALVHRLFGAATEREQQFLRRLLSGDLRQGALAGVMLDAISKATDTPLPVVRRAVMVAGDLPAVAAAALAGGREALAEFRLRVGYPVHPMLAQTSPSPEDALTTLGGEAAYEYKLDGARLQIHRDGDEVRLFTRTLDDVTARLPEVVAAIRAMPVRTLIADGEAIALRSDGRPESFQTTASRFGSRRDVEALRSAIPLHCFVFDVLHVDGTDVIDEPGWARAEALRAVVPVSAQVPRLVTSDARQAREFLDQALAAGHEGVVAKSLTAPYEAGRRGAGWLKIKPVRTLDLVVLAVEWGSGRRRGWLSNIHLGARDDVSGGFVMLGKTFKGMTDEMLRWQTERFTALAVGPTESHVVRVRPEQVVEIAFDGVQRSSRYPGGVALRFARVLRYRDDKPPSEADTLEAVRAILAEAE